MHIATPWRASWVLLGYRWPSERCIRAVADSAPVDVMQAAAARVKNDVPALTEWGQSDLSISSDMVSLLATAELVELSPHEKGEVRILVAVAPDGKTYRFTNDPDLAAIIDATGLKPSLGRDPRVCPAIGRAARASGRGEGDSAQRGVSVLPR